MKKVTTILAVILLMAVGAAAQKLSYQAVVRNRSNEFVPNTALTVEVSVLDAVGTVQYAETHSAITNENGLLVLTIGDGTVTTGTTVADVDWNGAAIQSVVKNGSAVVATITSPVNAVPYALQAGSSAGSLSQVNADWEATSGVAEILHKPTIPTTVAELTDAGDYVTDAELASAGYLTSETDPTVPAWAKESVKPAYDYSEITNTPDLTPYLTAETDPTVNDGVLTITLPDGTSETFTANQGGNTNVSIPAMSVADLLDLVNNMTDAEKEQLRDALGVTGGGSSDPTTFVCGTSKMVDADGNEYETVEIGTQCWTKTNLRVAPAGATDATSSGSSSNTVPYYYVKPGVDAATNGYYYNWEAAKLACPTGWHLPSDAEWTTMEQTQTSMDVTGTGWRGDHAGKLAGEGWNSSTKAGAPGNASDPDHNASGFSAVPAGSCSGSSFDDAGYSASFWSSTQNASNPSYVYYRLLYNNYASVYRLDYYKNYGYSVRCLRDAEPGGGEEPTSFNCGTSKMVDADGNEYETVEIGTQCWTKTNLRVAPAGATDATSSGAYSNTEPYYYVKPGVDAATNGYYYNWEAAKLACPTGWHLPSDAEWNTLEETVSGSDWQASYATATGYRGSHAGKLAGDGWNSSSTAGAPGNAADANHNASGFSAVPAGFWSYGFDYAGNDAYFWSSTEDGAGSAWHRILYYSYAGVLRTTSSRYGGFSVRCLRD